MKTAFLVLTFLVLPLHLLSMPKNFLGLGAKGRPLYPAMCFTAALAPVMVDSDLAYKVGVLHGSPAPYAYRVLFLCLR